MSKTSNIIAQIKALPPNGTVRLELSMPKAKWQTNILFQMLLEKAADMGIEVSLIGEQKHDKPER